MVPGTNPALPECKAQYSTFCLMSLISPFWEVISMDTEGCSYTGALRWPRRFHESQPGIGQIKSVHPWSSVSAPLWVNPKLLTLPALTPGCFLCTMSQCSPPDLGLYSNSNYLTTAAVAQPNGPITPSQTPCQLLDE